LEGKIQVKEKGENKKRTREMTAWQVTWLLCDTYVVEASILCYIIIIISLFY